MNFIAKQFLGWFNVIMKNNTPIIKEKIVKRYFQEKIVAIETKSTDINILLNRVKTNQKNEYKKKIYFSAIASTGLILFGFLIF